MTLLLLLSICAVLSVQSKSIFDGVRADDPKAIAESLKDGADINMIGNGGQTPLMNAVLSGKLQAVQYLLSQGADTSIGEKDGYTPMHGAGFQGRAEIAKVLIEHGLNPRDKHQDGYEAIHRAAWGREERHMQIAKVLVEAGVPYDAKSDNGQTPLGMATPGSPIYEYLKKVKQESDHQEI